MQIAPARRARRAGRTITTCGRVIHATAFIMQSDRSESLDRYATLLLNIYDAFCFDLERFMSRGSLAFGIGI